MARRVRGWLIGLLLGGAATGLVVAQGWRPFEAEPNIPYDGRFTFARREIDYIDYIVYALSH